MRKLISIVIMLACALNAMPAIAADDSGVSRDGAVFCAGLDLASGIAAVSGLVRTKTPLRAQLNAPSSDDETDTAAAASSRYRACGGVRDLKSFEMRTLAAGLPADISLCAVQPLAARGSPGGGFFLLLFILGYLVTLARANLPWAAVTYCFLYERTRSDVKRPGFYFGSPL
jgi:hypothetical protein